MRNSYGERRKPGQTPACARLQTGAWTDRTSRYPWCLVAESAAHLASAARTARRAQSNLLDAGTPSARSGQTGSTPGSAPGRARALGWDQRAGAVLASAEQTEWLESESWDR